MRDDRLPIGRAELVMIVNDVEQRFVDLADVVKQRDALDGVAALVVEPGRFGDDQRVGCDATDVLSGFAHRWPRWR